MNKKILIIEDTDSLRTSIAEVLQLEGFEVIQTADGFEGVNLAIEHLPDLILCDILMPGISGYDVLERIKQHPPLATVPLVFITALSDRTNVRKGMDMGADDYLVKPFTIEELLSAVNSRIKVRQSIEKFFTDRLDQIEMEMREHIETISSQNAIQNSTIRAMSQSNEGMKTELKEYRAQMMNEALRAIETNSSLQHLAKVLSEEIDREGIDKDQRAVLINLRNKILRGNAALNNWSAFQLQFNMIYPEFINKVLKKFPHLTQQNLFMISAMYINLNTEQLSLLLGISPDSVRKFKYRLKKKLGLKKDQSLLHYIHSLG